MGWWASGPSPRSLPGNDAGPWPGRRSRGTPRLDPTLLPPVTHSFIRSVIRSVITFSSLSSSLSLSLSIPALLLANAHSIRVPSVVLTITHMSTSNLADFPLVMATSATTTTVPASSTATTATATATATPATATTTSTAMPALWKRSLSPALAPAPAPLKTLIPRTGSLQPVERLPQPVLPTHRAMTVPTAVPWTRPPPPLLLPAPAPAPQLPLPSHYYNLPPQQQQQYLLLQLLQQAPPSSLQHQHQHHPQQIAANFLPAHTLTHTNLNTHTTTHPHPHTQQSTQGKAKRQRRLGTDNSKSARRLTAEQRLGRSMVLGAVGQKIRRKLEQRGIERYVRSRRVVWIVE